MRSFPGGKEIMNHRPDYCFLYWNNDTSARCLWVGNTYIPENHHVVHVGPKRSTCERVKESERC